VHFQGLLVLVETLYQEGMVVQEVMVEADLVVEIHNQELVEQEEMHHLHKTLAKLVEIQEVLGKVEILGNQEVSRLVVLLETEAVIEVEAVTGPLPANLVRSRLALLVVVVVLEEELVLRQWEQREEHLIQEM
jgi:hypothetical protein